jgi:hypothetical protein
VEGCCEHGNEPAGSIWEILECLSDCFMELVSWLAGLFVSQLVNYLLLIDCWKLSERNMLIWKIT